MSLKSAQVKRKTVKTSVKHWGGENVYFICEPTRGSEALSTSSLTWCGDKGQGPYQNYFPHYFFLEFHVYAMILWKLGVMHANSVLYSHNFLQSFAALACRPPQPCPGALSCWQLRGEVSQPAVSEGGQNRLDHWQNQQRGSGPRAVTWDPAEWMLNSSCYCSQLHLKYQATQRHLDATWKTAIILKHFDWDDFWKWHLHSGHLLHYSGVSCSFSELKTWLPSFQYNGTRVHFPWICSTDAWMYHTGTILIYMGFHAKGIWIMSRNQMACLNCQQLFVSAFHFPAGGSSTWAKLKHRR